MHVETFLPLVVEGQHVASTAQQRIENFVNSHNSPTWHQWTVRSCRVYVWPAVC